VPRSFTSSGVAPGPVDLGGKPLEAGHVAFRFIMSGGFGGVSAVRVERTADGASIDVETAVGPRHHMASREQWDLLASTLEGAGFWSEPEEDPMPSPRVKDGDAWVIEGLRDGVRHRVVRRNPRIKAKERGLADFLALCRAMATLGEIECGDAGCLPIDSLKAAPARGRP
jgi:hypothetical protein